ncbi:hypothetical protein [Campylobacter concisus]|uniref:hypothetical protein n=1 Tax=Campylobacter concisus TaxID=199 RepID=UPI000D30434A|nr:hypothetical protein [Campylobacter concisus]
MTDFKQETIELIGDHKVDEYFLKYKESWGITEDLAYKGKDKIDWDAIPKPELTYDGGYGTQNWRGFITFKDTPDWLEREEYDGMEWWVWRSKPSLEKVRRKNK